MSCLQHQLHDARHEGAGSSRTAKGGGKKLDDQKQAARNAEQIDKIKKKAESALNIQQQELAGEDKPYSDQDGLSEAYRMNLWAWRLFMIGVFVSLLGGIGIFFQIPAMYMAAQASSKSGGVYGEKLWRAVRGYFVFLAAAVIIVFSFCIFMSFYHGNTDVGIGLSIAFGIALVISYILHLVYKDGVRPDSVK